MILNRSAHQKPSTLNPGTISETSNIISALITKVKRPIVKILIGKLRRRIIGLRKVLISPKTIATSIAGQKPTRVTPGKRYAVRAVARAVTIILIMSDIKKDG